MCVDMFDALEGEEHHCEYDGLAPVPEKMESIVLFLLPQGYIG